jgi:phage terminase large subunit
MPDVLRDMFEYSAEYVRMKAAPNERYARARTASKENPEALAWVHGPFVCLLVDEASWVCEEVFEVAQGALTNENTLFIMISNPTRLEWYFYDSHNKYKSTFRRLHFNSEQSPIVTSWLINSIIEEKGQDSEEYDIRVKGNFPNVEWLDDWWYVPLVNHARIRQTMNTDMMEPLVLWVDPSWEGDDETVRVVKDQFKAKVVAKEKISSGKTIAQKTIEIADAYGISDDCIIVDEFWVWSDTVKQLALAGRNVNNLYLWAESEDKKTYLNKRAELYRKMRLWLTQWWELVRHNWREEIKSIKYKRIEWRNVIQIEPKERMRKRWIKSPNVADAFMLTFAMDPQEMPEVLMSNYL